MEEIRVAVVDGEKLDKFDFETPSKAQIKGNIYLAKIIRVEPSLQAAFVDYGGERHGFLSFSEIHHDYFQIPVGDRKELEERIQSAMAARTEESVDDEMDPREISRLRYQFYRRYKIQEVIKKRQIMLVQVTKEERGNKGAALTTYISLAGRYCVLMPNMSKGSGVSRKVVNPADREKLKALVAKLYIENGSTVIRTAGIGRSKLEIKKDFDYLKKLWDEIREITLKSTAPCLIYEEANIIKRAIRDLYSRDVESIIVEGEEGYKIAKNYIKKLMPSHAKKVVQYTDTKVPLFSKYKINEQVNQIYSTRVDLPSGGYLVINTTEALISIDVNSGRATRERNIAGTAFKTNIEAAMEIARQCRLRDLAGLIVVDFIDMEEKRNNAQVERVMRESLREDKAKIQLGSISHFGLLEFSRQRMRSSIADANMITCPHCNGCGIIWSDESIALQILRKIEEACFAMDLSEVTVTLSSDVALYLLNNKRTFIASIEQRGLKINFIIDPSIAAADFKITQVVKAADSYSDDDSEITAAKKYPPKDKNIVGNKRYTGGTIYVPINTISEMESQKTIPEIPEIAEVIPMAELASAEEKIAEEKTVAEASDESEVTESEKSATPEIIDVRRPSRNRRRKGERDTKNIHFLKTQQPNADTEKTLPPPQEFSAQKDNEAENDAKKVFTLNVKKKEIEPPKKTDQPTENKKKNNSKSRSSRSKTKQRVAENDNALGKEKIDAEASNIQNSSKYVPISDMNLDLASGDSPKEGIVAGFMISEKHKILTQFVESYFNYERNFERKIIAEEIEKSTQKKSRSGWWKKLIKKPEGSKYE
jgi:ribonuclease E